MGGGHGGPSARTVIGLRFYNDAAPTALRERRRMGDGERNRPGCTVSRLAERNLRKMVAHRKVSGAMPNTAGGTPALPFQKSVGLAYL